jgi:hypothetical protein
MDAISSHLSTPPAGGEFYGVSPVPRHFFPATARRRAEARRKARRMIELFYSPPARPRFPEQKEWPWSLDRPWDRDHYHRERAKFHLRQYAAKLHEQALVEHEKMLRHLKAVGADAAAFWKLHDDTSQQLARIEKMTAT